MPYFQNNISALQQRYPDTPWDLILSPMRGKMPAEMQMVNSRSGLPTLLSLGQAVHSQYNPEAEADKVVQSLEQDVDAYLVIGLGLGYLARAIYKIYPKKVLVLIEPEVPIFVTLISAFDMTHLILDTNVYFFFSTSKDDFLQLLRKLSIYSLQSIPNRTLTQRCPEYYEAIQKEARLYILRKSVNFKTIQEQGALWLHNLCRNMQHFACTPGVSHLHNVLSDFPALLIAAGPSVDSLWPHIQMAAQRFVIVCVDTALRILLQHDIIPDFIIAVDSQYWNSRHLDNCRADKSIFVADPSLYPTILRQKETFHFFLTSSLFPMGKYIEERVEIKGEILSGGSVSTSAFDLCRRLGVNSIWTIGLDLAFPDGRTHARGARFEEWALCDGMRLSPAENFFIQQSYTTFPSYYPANHGGMVLTDKRMEVYRLWFEDQAQTVECFNLSEGVKIEHMTTGTWAQLEKLPVCRPQIDVIMQQLLTIEVNKEALQEKLQAALQEMQKELQTVRRLCLEAETETKKLLTNLKNNKNVKKHLDKLQNIDQSLAQSHSKEFLAFLLEPFFQQFHTSQGQVSDPIESLKKSSQLYTQLAASTEFYQRLLKVGDLPRPQQK